MLTDCESNLFCKNEHVILHISKMLNSSFNYCRLNRVKCFPCNVLLSIKVSGCYIIDLSQVPWWPKSLHYNFSLELHLLISLGNTVKPQKKNFPVTVRT